MPTLQEILANGGDPTAPGLLGLINRGTSQFGGAGNLGLALLANSGPSATPRTFGQILGQSAIDSQNMQAGRQEQALKQRLVQAQLAALQAKPAVNPVSVPAGSTLIDPTTGKAIYAAPAKPDELPAQAKEFEYAQKNGFSGSFLDWQQRAQRPEITADIQGYNLAKEQGFKGSYLDYKKQLAQTSKGGTFNDQAGALMASLATAGVSLPTGMRSKEQQIATMNALLAKFPDKTPDEIAQLIAGGQIDFGAARKETQTAAAQAGRVAIATNELNTFAPIVLAASAKVPRSSFVPINKLMQMGQESISDPNLLQLKISINSMLNAYDQLAARGGTDAKKREEAHSLLMTAHSPEALAAGIAMFQKEANAAGEAASQAEKYRRPGASPTTVPPTNADGWVLHTDKNGNRAYVSPDGTQYQEVQ